MRGFAWACLAVAVVVLSPIPSAAVVATFPVAPVGTSVVPEGSIKLTSETGQEIVVKPGETRDVPAGTYTVDTKLYGFWGDRTTCVIPAGGGPCTVPANPIRPHQVQTPPFGGLFFGLFADSMHVSNIPTDSRRELDLVGGDRFANRLTRQQRGERNARTDTHATMTIAGAEGSVGLPQLLLSTLLINSAIQIMLGGADLTLDTHAHADNRGDSRKITADGVALGGGAEMSAVSVTYPIGLRLGVKYMGGTVDGSLARRSANDDGGLFTPTSASEVSGSWSRFSGRADVLFPVFPKVGFYTGINYHVHDFSMETVTRGTSGGVDATRTSQHAFRGDSWTAHAGADFALYSFSSIPPVGGRFELGYSPCGCFEAFLKFGIMFGGNGIWSPRDIL